MENDAATLENNFIVSQVVKHSVRSNESRYVSENWNMNRENFVYSDFITAKKGKQRKRLSTEGRTPTVKTTDPKRKQTTTWTSPGHVLGQKGPI